MGSEVINYQRGLLKSSRWLSCQPGYFSPALRYREFQVPSDKNLNGRLTLLYEAGAGDGGLRIPVIPDGCVDLVFSFREGHCADVSVCGTITTFYSMELRRDDFIFGVRFLPGKFPLFRAASMDELLNRQQSLQLTDHDRAFVRLLAAAPDFEARVPLALRYLQSFCGAGDTISYKEKLIDCSMRQICASSGNLNIRLLSDELVYSPRYIEQVFKERTGFSPKSMCRLTRMHRAVLMLLWGEGGSRTEVSVECGYADLSHMNRDIHHLLGIHGGEINQRDFYAKSTSEATAVYRF